MAAVSINTLNTKLNSFVVAFITKKKNKLHKEAVRHDKNQYRHVLLLRSFQYTTAPIMKTATDDSTETILKYNKERDMFLYC